MTGNETETPNHRGENEIAPTDRLPWLVNGSLSQRENAEVESALRRDGAQRDELAALHRLAASVRGQEEAPLAPATWSAIRRRTGLALASSRARVTESAPARAGVPTSTRARVRPSPWRIAFPRLAGALAMALLVAAGLWAFLRPGTHVAWTAQSDEAVTFRVYRGDPEDASFHLWRELPASTESTRYRLIDHRPAVGPKAYRIEAVGQGRLIAFRETIVTGGWGVLLNQLAILVFSSVVAATALRWQEDRARMGGPRLARSA